MRKLVYILFFISLVFSANGQAGRQKRHAVSIPRKDVEVTAADATRAFDAFNRYFYDAGSGLYHRSTNQKVPGAIWTQAIFLEMVMDAYRRTGDPATRKMIGDICSGGYQEYAGYDWHNKKVWFIYDDMMWWIGALARASRVTGNKKYLKWSVAGFKRVWDSAWDKGSGGMFWQFKHDAKNACINYPTVIAAMRLFGLTGDSTYLQKARSVYGWSREHLFDTVSGRVADHVMADGMVGWEDYTYNQGTCIGAAVMLYKITDSAFYLRDAELAADYTKNRMCDAGGILPAEGAWNEQGVLKAIFARYIMLLIKNGHQDRYLPWIQHNIQAAWANRDTTRELTYRNYKIPCPTGTLQSYEASSAVEFMQVCPLPDKKINLKITHP
ncbi:MAG TPA: glycoside hydrolase family 76 protein [Chitinophagaceae bacterium]|nr:glycoside hydrolase family 76 protein [Chitinophagaceae bacterium]